MDLHKLQSELQEAIYIRENGDLQSSRILFDRLISKVKKSLGVESPKEFKNFYVTAMGEYVIQYRLEGGKKYGDALKVGLEVYEFNKKNNLKNLFGPRSVSHVFQNLDNFEEAEPYLRELISLTDNNPYRQGDEMAHLSLCLFRTGRVEEAEKLIDVAIKKISASGSDEKYKNVPYSRSLMFKALILNGQGKKVEALNLAREALQIAEKDNLPFRIMQARVLVNLLEGKFKAQ